jgi:hypothetical protein
MSGVSNNNIPANNTKIDKTTKADKVDRTNKDVPAPPTEVTNETPAFTPDCDNEIKKYDEGNAPVNKSLKLCSYEPDEPGIYQCTAKINPDGKLDPGIFQCTAKVDPNGKQEPGIIQCSAKVDPKDFDCIKGEPTDLKDLFKTDTVKKDEPEIKHAKPEIYSCTYKTEPGKSNDQPKIFSCTYKTEPGKTDNNSHIYSCTYKLDLDEDDKKIL